MRDGAAQAASPGQGSIDPGLVDSCPLTGPAAFQEKKDRGDARQHRLFPFGADLEDDLSGQLHGAVRAVVINRGEEVERSQRCAGRTEILPVEAVEHIQLQLQADAFGQLGCLENAGVEIVIGLSAQRISSHARIGIAACVGCTNVVGDMREEGVGGHAFVSIG